MVQIRKLGNGQSSTINIGKVSKKFFLKEASVKAQELFHEVNCISAVSKSRFPEEGAGTNLFGFVVRKENMEY